MNKPRCVIVTGRPATGKTTLSKKLGKLLCLPVLSRDELKQGYVVSAGKSHRELPSSTNGVVSNAFIETVQMLLEAKVSIIVEAAFQHRVWSSVVPNWQIFSDVSILQCTLPAEVCSERYIKRGLDDPRIEFFHGDNGVRKSSGSGKCYVLGEYDAPRLDCPMLEVNTEDGYNPSVTKIQAWLGINLPISNERHRVLS